MILVPPEVPKSRLADQLPGRLIAQLRRYNAVHSVEAAVQFRVGLHAGDVHQDGHGAVSPAVNCVLGLLPATELARLREWLEGIAVPQLPTLVHRATGPDVPPAPSGTTAWEVLCYLTDFNAGADGFPPAGFERRVHRCRHSGACD